MQTQIFKKMKYKIKLRDKMLGANTKFPTIFSYKSLPQHSP